MSESREADAGTILAPLQACGRVLAAIWQRAEKEGDQRLLFEEWVQEVGNWAGLEEWKARVRQELHNGAHLWLPSDNIHELGVLLAIADLASEIGSSPTQLARAIMASPQAKVEAVNYQPLIEALNDWQATFELALDEAAARLDNKQFPARDLSASLDEMCGLLRDVLSRNSGVNEIQ